MDERETGVAVGRVDESPRRERRQPVLRNATFGGEAAVHDGERALGVGSGRPGREREVGAEPMVAGAVVELVGDAQEAFAGAQLERRAHRDGDCFVTARAARAGVAVRIRRPRVVGVDLHPCSHRAVFERGDSHGVGRVDNTVDLGRRVVVGVASVTVVDEPAQAGDAQFFGDDGVCAGRRVDLHLEVTVRENGFGGMHGAARSLTVDGCEARPTEAVDLTGVEQCAPERRLEQTQAHRLALRAEVEDLIAQLGEIAMRIAGTGFLQHDLVHGAGVLDFVRRDVASGELGAAHEIEHPTHLLAGDHRRVDLAADLADELGRAACRARRPCAPGRFPAASLRRARSGGARSGFTTTVAPARRRRLPRARARRRE